MSEADAIRRFNRFYTGRIGVLSEGLLASPLGLPEARVIFEVARHGVTTAAELQRVIGLDAGYASRLLRRLERKGLLRRERSRSDGRQNLVRLTQEGQNAFASLDTRSRAEMSALLDDLSAAERNDLLSAMRTIERLLSADAPSPAVSLRQHRPGDIGWMVKRHGEIYADEFGFDQTFEALVARIGADFLDRIKPHRERFWIAEIDGRRAGCVFLVEAAPDTAKLRCLLVEPWARGHGIGRRLVAECVSFARSAGYDVVSLWTQQNLSSARRLYEAEGFKRIVAEAHHSFGADLVAETWERPLR